MPSLKQRALKATAWSGADAFLRQGLSFGISVALARLIAPEQFGVIALLYLFTGLATVFIDSGFSSALIQKQDSTPVDESTVFWFNLLIGAIAAVLLGAAAPLIARFFAQPVLVPLTWLLAFSVFISALGAIHTTLLTRELDFKTQMKIGAVTTVVSGATAIALAIGGYGVWALAWQQVVAACCTTALLWILHPWRPRAEFSRASAHELFGFGGYMLASSLLDTGFNRLYTVLVGKLFGVRELGFYNRANGTQQMPAGFLSGILSRVAFPIYSAASSDKAQLKRGVQLSVRGIMLINAPTMLGMAAVAKPLIVTVFGARWAPAAPILQILCIGGVFWPLHVINLNVLMAQGHSNLFFRLEAIKKVLGVLMLVGGALFGVLGVAWAMAIFGVVAFFINAFYTGRYLGYSSLAQVRDIAPIIVLSIAMALLVAAVGDWWRPTPPIALVALVALGAVFMAAATPLFRLAALTEAIQLVRSRHPARVTHE